MCCVSQKKPQNTWANFSSKLFLLFTRGGLLRATKQHVGHTMHHVGMVWYESLLTFLDLAVAKSLQSTRTVTDADDDADDDDADDVLTTCWLLVELLV